MGGEWGKVEDTPYLVSRTLVKDSGSRLGSSGLGVASLGGPGYLLCPFSCLLCLFFSLMRVTFWACLFLIRNPKPETLSPKA